MERRDILSGPPRTLAELLICLGAGDSGGAGIIGLAHQAARKAPGVTRELKRLALSEPGSSAMRRFNGCFCGSCPGPWADALRIACTLDTAAAADYLEGGAASPSGKKAGSDRAVNEERPCRVLCSDSPGTTFKSWSSTNILSEIDGKKYRMHVADMPSAYHQKHTRQKK